MEFINFINYTGTKTVKACPMSRKTAEEFIGRKVYKDSDEREDEEGYLVRYVDGYQSWSPAKVFEEAYARSQSHLDRMIIEHKELKDRYLKGRDYSFSQAANNMSVKKISLLKQQLDIMERYLYVLTERISIEEKEILPTRSDNKANPA
ncbi:hypothetical protein L6472_05905 [Prevotella sp. E13-17]|uniref:crAss001_48 related protein n=1 Tax=Prevotella sp. E13-17 TaxID=2913616 RepID=UPI001ED9F9D8|nr:hypothetical protein [Prevotella sp. E13-17]UKK52111.1 hypothetical protein L6472_05905 [Prevotella sp. E13-17]